MMSMRPQVVAGLTIPLDAFSSVSLKSPNSSTFSLFLFTEVRLDRFEERYCTNSLVHR